MWAEAGEPDLESLGSVLDGKLLGRRPGLRKDDLIEIHLDARSFPPDADTIRRGRLISTGKTSIELRWRTAIHRPRRHRRSHPHRPPTSRLSRR